MQARHQQPPLKLPSQPHPAALSLQPSPQVARGAPILLLGPPSQAVSVLPCPELPAAGVEMALGAEQEDTVALEWVDLEALAQLGCLEVLIAADVVHGRAGPGFGAQARSGLEFGQLAGQYTLPSIAGYTLTPSALRQPRLYLPPSPPQSTDKS
jgi:hypothetical protein